MLLNLLFEKEFQKFFEISGRKQSQVIVYVHIPKAAGNSSLHYLKRFKKNYYNVQWNDVDNSWQEFLRILKLEKCELVSGHFSYYHVDFLKKMQIPYRSISFLRHPIDRIISQYRYMTTEAHPEHRAFVKKYPSFDEFALNVIKPNPMARQLVGKTSSFHEVVKSIIEEYQFIGIKEYYNSSMYLLCKMINIPFQKAPKRNITKENTKNKFEISHSTYLKLQRIHAVDLDTFKFFFDNYQKITDALIGLIGERNDILDVQNDQPNIT
jgi:hypothetical protein